MRKHSGRTHSHAPKVLTLTDMVAAIRHCHDPCAAPLIRTAPRLHDLPLDDVKLFKKSIDACYRRCR